MEAGSGHEFENTQRLDLARQQRGKERLNETREYGKLNPWRYETKDLKALKAVAWRVSEEYIHSPLELIMKIAVIWRGFLR